MKRSVLRPPHCREGNRSHCLRTLSEWGFSVPFFLLLSLAFTLPAMAEGDESSALDELDEREEVNGKMSDEAGEETPSAYDGPDWVPGLALSWGGHSQKISGRTNSSTSNFRERPADSLLTQLIQFDARLLTPLALDVPSHPRLFLNAGFQIPLADELIATRVDQSFDRGSSSQFAVNCPDTIPGPGGAPTPASTCELSIRNKVTPEAMWFAGLGIDFSIDVFDTTFHIAPGVDYYGIQAEAVGLFRRSSSALFASDFVEVANAVGNGEIYHGISPNLSLEVETYEEGPLRITMFVRGRIAFLLNDPLTTASTALATDDLVFRVKLDDTLYSGNMGFRLEFIGKNGFWR